MSIINRSWLLLLITTTLLSCTSQNQVQSDISVKQVMDDLITRLYKEVPEEKYNSIDEDFILDFLDEKEENILATQYQYFKVNVPVKVSLMRSKNQKIVPFWLEKSGFVKSDGIVRNEVYEYEIWQKEFDAGKVNLGINGFDMHRTVYFISVGPINPNDKLEITDIYPSQYEVIPMKKGAFTYHDWSSLFIEELPDELIGQQLFTTVRGRAREAHVKGAFRATKFASTAKPDQILLTWSGDPTSSVNIQWRTGTSVDNGIVKYWIKGSTDTIKMEANKFVMEDRMLYNDRYIHRFTANLENLDDGQEYQYIVGGDPANSWSDVRNFKTEVKGKNNFSFIWFGDTHRDPDWAKMLLKANSRHPETAFYSIAGDMVSTGLYRSEWDELFGYTKDVFSYKPLMPVLGNHDRQDGLGAWMFYELFALPENGPAKVHTESTYAFEYGNTLFLMIDSTHPNEDQTAWIDETLKNSDASWKFAMFHFPPYNYEEPYFDIQEEWCGIFDAHHVDMVMGGHIHYYMRSKPIKNGEIMDSHAEGTVYAVSIGTKGNHSNIGQEPYAEKRYKEGQFYQHMEIDNNVLTYTAYNQEGSIKDQFTITKPKK